MTGWRAALDDTDAALLDGFQRGLPLRERPFRSVARAVGTTEADVVSRLERLVERGVVRRVGPVFDPPAIGSSTLAAASVPAGSFDEAARVVNGYDEVNHNYRRASEWNMWFVVTAPTRTRRDGVLEEIEARIGRDVLALPMVTEYDIDLTFPVVNDDRVAREGRAESDSPAPTDVSQAALDLSAAERRVVLATQGGLPITPTPYANVADDLAVPTSEVLAALEGLSAAGGVKRVGCVLDHHAVGFDSNCMVAWAVPPGEIDERGVAAARHPAVTYCCRRAVRPDAGWPYALFTMIHGRSRAAVDATVDELAADALPVEHERLHTEAVLKQTGLRWRDLLEGAGGRERAEAGVGGRGP